MDSPGASRFVPPGAEVGGYVLEGMLGSGGFGAVYRARRGLETHALKLLRLEHVGGWAEREVALLLRLKHRNVVGFRGCGYWPDDAPRFLYLAMEYVDGQRLDAWAELTKPTAREVASKVLDVARALSAVHEARAVHRDVKEANILVRHDDGRAVLVDFGAGGYEGAPGLTVMLLPPGTAEYRSPEAWRFAREHAHSAKAHYVPGPRDDLYALGVVLYRLLTGLSPHAEARDRAAADERLPRPPHLLNPRVPRALSKVCLRLLAPRPQDRYADARAACSALEAVLADAGPADTPTPADGARSRRQVRDTGRRRRLALGVLCVAMLAGLWGAVASGHFGAFMGSGRAVALTAHAEDARAGLSVGEVAGAGQAPEADQAAAPPWEETTAVAAVTVTANPQDTASVTTQKTSRTEASRPPRASFAKAALAATCMQAGAACTGHQVRPPPRPEECPPGAIEAMRALGIDDEAEHLVTMILPGDKRHTGLFPVREGPALLRVAGPWEGMEENTILAGQFIIGEERVFGRFTEARMPGGKTLPVCLEMGDRTGGNGSIREPDDGSGTIRIFSSMVVVAVRRFQ